MLYVVKFIAELYLVEGIIIHRYLPSVFAAATLAVANYIGTGVTMSSSRWYNVTGYDHTNLTKCVKDLQTILVDPQKKYEKVLLKYNKPE